MILVRAKIGLGRITSVMLIGGFMISCGSGIKFTKSPIVIPNPNKSTPLTCYIDFETNSPYEWVSFFISDADRTYQLRYTSDEEMETGYLLALMRPGQDNKIKVEVTDLKGHKYVAENELVFRTPPLPSGVAEFPKIEITKIKPDQEIDEDIYEGDILFEE